MPKPKEAKVEVEGRNIEIWLTTAEDDERGDFVDAMFNANGEETFNVADAVEVAFGNEIHVLAKGDSLAIEVVFQ